MKDYSNYYTPINDRILSDAELVFEKQLETLEGKDANVDGIDCRALVRNHLNAMNELKEERYLCTRKVLIIKRGSIVEFDNEVYMVTTDIDDHYVYNSCKVQKTNHTLKFLNSQGQICNNSNGYPCIYVNKSSNLIGIDENKFLTSPKTIATIDLPSNSETNLIIRGNRFLVGDNAFKVTSVDKITMNGIVHLVLEEDVVTTNDNLILGIADYYNNLHTYSIDITNTDAILLVNDTLQLNAICKDNNEVVESPIVTYVSSNTSIATVDSNGVVTCLTEGNATITATYNGVDDSLNLTVQSVPVADDFSIVINGLDLIPIGQTKTYNAVVYNNGLEVSNKTVIWSLNNSNASIVNQSGLSVSVKAGSVANVNVELKAELSDDVSVVGVKNIGIKSLY